MSEPADTLIGNFDAQIWAKEFCSRFTVERRETGTIQDEGLMLGWFANAIMAGYDKGREHERTKSETYRKALEEGKRLALSAVGALGAEAGALVADKLYEWAASQALAETTSEEKPFLKGYDEQTQRRLETELGQRPPFDGDM